MKKKNNLGNPVGGNGPLSSSSIQGVQQNP
jgi:hypothetical protein